MSEIISVRPITDSNTPYILENMQRDIWVMTDDREVVPAHIIIGIVKNGGMLLGAYIENRLAGFSLSLDASDSIGKYHYMHMLGVLPEYRAGTGKLGVGSAIMNEHRKRLLAIQIGRLKWTFDPLQSRNASLYIRKLGADIISYEDDYYGNLPDDENRDFPSDRVVTEWNLLKNHREMGREPWKEVSVINPSVEVPGPDLKFGNTVFLKNPVDVTNLSPEDISRWRIGTRTWFHWLMDQDWRLVGYNWRKTDAGYYFGYNLQE